jgi:hypothetical protein
MMETVSLKRHEALMECMQWHLTNEVTALASMEARWNALIAKISNDPWNGEERHIEILPNGDPLLDVVDSYILDNLSALTSRYCPISSGPEPKGMELGKLLIEDDAKCAVVDGWKDRMTEKGQTVAAAILALDVSRLSDLTGIDKELTIHQLGYQRYKAKFLKNKVLEKDYVLGTRYLGLEPLEGENAMIGEE